MSLLRRDPKQKGDQNNQISLLEFASIPIKKREQQEEDLYDLTRLLQDNRRFREDNDTYDKEIR